MDNKQLKDGIGNLFFQRMRDVSAAQDGSVMRTLLYTTLYPIDYEPGGCYQHTGRSGVMAAGLAASSPIYSFQYTYDQLGALVRRVRLSAWTVSTAFPAAAVAVFELFVARGFTAADSGGTAADFTSNHATLRDVGPSAMGNANAAIRYAATAALTPGTRTLDPDPADVLYPAIPTTVPAPIATRATIFEKLQGEHPLVLAKNEGFVIRATMPATGQWAFAVTTEWDEVPLF